MTTHTIDRPLELARLVPELVTQGLLGQDDGERVLQQRHGLPAAHPLVYLAEQRLDDLSRPGQPLSLEHLTLWLALQAGQAYWRIDPLDLELTRLSALLPGPFAQRYGIVVVAEEPPMLIIASAQPFITSWLPALAQALKRPIKQVVANPLDIQRCTEHFYLLNRSLRGASPPPLAEPEPALRGAEGEPGADEAPVVSLVDWLLQHAFEQRASDIHLEPRREQGRVRFRIDGQLHDVQQFQPTILAAMVSRLKSLGRMNIAEKRRPQDGRIHTRLPQGGEVELRLSTLPTAFGEKMVLRVFDPLVLLRDFASLGFTKRQLALWEDLLRQPHGIILVTGPTGSGKTTTLYSALKRLASSRINLCTIEDPIEMLEPAFNQMQVQHNIDLTFASGLRALMRQDPDVIMVGEIRDLETAQMAIQAALTGHLVLSTLHTNDAAGAITRLLELGVPHYLLKATLLGVMGQRLVRTLCVHCSAPQPVPVPTWEALTRPWRIRPPASSRHPGGCAECRDTGYRGRTALYEILVLGESLRECIVAGTDVAALRRQACREGMRSLRVAGAQKVAAGVTSIEEVLRTTPGYDFHGSNAS
ncbi:ATPase, T2SS/T4P/T4SS family [Pseudomonas sp. HR96]|uniref:GspE/PulE family protein n=1 Tax=Pseudomonas sp. HR96 TaxID=1027966 RepID=UPI002A7487F7|nr:ATPase, T2SS/T4P/T4SS family [Pseudomonas sp. HR96]WPO99744.1 ATPase, T2SS/T4P/T4SS family [Pseudomonas sp. HR96]